MATLTDAIFLQNLTYSAEQTRRFTTALLKRGSTVGSQVGGLVASTDYQVTYAGTGLEVSVAEGECYIPGTTSTHQGAYQGRLGTATTLTPAAADPTNPRIDLVCLTIQDSAYSGSSNDGLLQILTGTPTSGATLSNLDGAPTLPTSSYALAYVLIPAGATTISNSDIDNVSTTATMELAAGTGGQGISITSGAIGLNGTESVNYQSAAGSAQTLKDPATDIVNKFVLSANLTISPYGSPSEGMFTYIAIQQAASGGPYTVTWSGFKNPGGTAPTMTTTASAIDLYGAEYLFGQWNLVTLGQNFS